MKRLFFALMSVAALTFTACNTNNPDGPIPDSFPKKHLIEEFSRVKTVVIALLV